MGIEVLGPDINESEFHFTVNREGNIRFGLGAIKGVGENAVAHLLEERNAAGPFNDIYNLAERVNLNSLNKKTLEAMAVAGVFDCFEGTNRAQYFAPDSRGNSFIENLIRFGNSMKELRKSSQQSLFGEEGGFDIVRPEPAESPDWPKLEKLNREKEVIGIYLSSHPLDDFRLEMESFCTATLAELQSLKEYADREATVAGIVVEVRSGISKNGKPYGTFTLQDYTDSFRFMLFDKDYIDNSKYLNTGYYLLLKGKIQKRQYNDDYDFRIKTIHLLSSVREDLISSITIKARAEDITTETVSELFRLISENKGKTELKVQISDPAEKIRFRMFSRSSRVRLTNDFISFLDDHPTFEYKVN
jgi:DNA polymerase-3 subunit alpha